MFWRKTLFLLLACVLISGLANTETGFAEEKQISRLVLSKNQVTLETGDTLSLTATAVYVSGATENVTIKTDWESKNPDIASVYAGLITARAEGKATLTASYMGQTEIVDVTVSKKVKALTTNQQSLNVQIGQEAQVEVVAVYADGTSEDVTSKADWTIDNASVATVINGKVKGISSGTGTITARYGSQSVSVPLSVEIAHRLEPSKSKVSLLRGEKETIQLKAIFPDGSENDNVADKAVWSSSDPAVADALKGTITAYGAGTAVITATYGTKKATIQVDVDTTQKLVADKQDLFLKAGEETEIRLTATYANGGGEAEVTDKAEWSSSNENIAYYSRGKIHAVSSGEAVLTASYGGKTAQVKVDVEVPRALDIIPSLLTMKKGETKNVIARASFANGTTEEVTAKASWSSDKEDVVYAKNGVVSAYKAGTATVTASYGGKRATLVVDVDVPLSFTADVATVALQVGNTRQVRVTASFPDGESRDVTDQAEWKSSDTSVATVRQGLIAAVGTGSATVTATLGTRTLSIPVSVGVLQSLSVDKNKLVMSKGDSEQVKLTASYPDGTNKDVTDQAVWSSASAAVAEVYQGKITAVGAGTTNITATYNGKTVNISVEVDQAQSLSAEPRLLVLAVGETAEIKLTATDSAGNTARVTGDAVWSSANVKIADVVNGSVTGLSSGRTTITAKYGGKSVSIPVEVGILTKLEADKHFVSLKSKQAVQVTLTATFSDGRTMDVTSMADWKSGNYKTADVSKGLITGVAYGKTTVTARYNNKSVSIPVEVDVLKYLKTDVVQLVMNKGETKQVKAVATYMDGTEQDVTKPALWTTSRLLVADVKDGIIKATGSGKAIITVTYGNKSTKIVVNVR